MKKILVHLITLFFCSSLCFSQSHKADSIRNLLRTDKPDTIKLKHLNKLSREFSYSYSFDSAMKYAEAAMDLSNTLIRESKDPKVLKNAKKSQGYAYNIIGGVYYDQGNYPEALKNHLASLKIYEKLGIKYNIATAYTNIGLIYYFQGNYSDALKNHRASLKLYDEIVDTAGVGSSYNNIGIVFTDQKNYPEALKNHFASLKIKLSLDDKSGLAASYNNIGLVYSKQDSLKEAIKYENEALKLYEYLDDKAGISLTSMNIGDIFTKEKKFDQAEKYFLKAKKFSELTGYRENLKNIYSSLSFLDSAKGDYKGAFENHKKFIRYRDSLDNEQTRTETIQNQMTYDFEKIEAVADAEHKKELENQKALAEKKSRKQKIIIGFILFGLSLMLGFAFFIFRSLRITNKQKHIIEEQKDLVEQQKTVVEQQKNLVDEKQKEVIDSITYAKRLQKAILPSNDEIKKHLPNSFIFYKPKDIIAGDFYWLHVVERRSNEKIVLIAAADSTGHGVPGAMVSVVCSNALNRAVSEENLTDTGKILDKTRELVLETFAKSDEEISDGMDISLLAINYGSKEITWSGANNQLWYICNNNLIEIKADKQSIGKTDDAKPFSTNSIGFNEGDIYYLITDGYSDQFGGIKGKKFKYKQLQQFLLNISEMPMDQQHFHLDKCLQDWKGDLEQVDDITIIGIRI